jgi:ferredoxin
MEIIRDWGLDIKAECGGACACATCHVHVSSDWLDRLHPINAEEEDMLDQAFDVRDNSRLSCQLLMSEELDGLEVTGARHEDGGSGRGLTAFRKARIRHGCALDELAQACTSSPCELVTMIDKLEFFIVSHGNAISAMPPKNAA